MSLFPPGVLFVLGNTLVFECGKARTTYIHRTKTLRVRKVAMRHVFIASYVDVARPTERTESTKWQNLLAVVAINQWYVLLAMRIVDTCPFLSWLVCLASSSDENEND